MTDFDRDLSLRVDGAVFRRDLLRELAATSGRTEGEVEGILSEFPGSLEELWRFYGLHGRFPNGTADYKNQGRKES